MRWRRQLWPSIAVGLAVAGIVAASALAATIVGTAKSETLRGTPQADRIFGRGGNDKLYGLAGNDYLNGGAGVDQFFCGAGRDSVVAAAKEKVARDCEVVKRIVPPTPPPAEPPPPTEPPAPPPPAPPQAMGGTYCGFTNSGGGICLDVGGSGEAQFVTNGRFEQTTDCSGGARFRLSITLGSRVPLANLAFVYSVTQGELAGSEVKGTFDTAGNVSGSLVMKASFDHEGSHYTCESTTDWSAKIQR